MVLAGPGSGKTSVLTYRIARLLEESRNENFRILCLTFTNKAADEMRTRIKKLVSGMENRLFVGTFHSFCTDVLRNHGTHLGIKPDFTIYSDEKDLEELTAEITQQLISQNMVKPLSVRILPVIQYLQRNLYSYDQPLAELNQNADLKQFVEKIYKHYLQNLKELNALDFDSLILQTSLLFARYPFVAKYYRTAYPFICIDKFQDTNFGQYMLLKNLTKDQHKNIFIVADDDQVIYQWNGASYKRLKILFQTINQK